MAALSSLVTSYIRYKTRFIYFSFFQNQVTETEILQADSFFIHQTVQLLNDTAQYFQRNGSTAISRNREDLILHEVTTMHEQSSYANTTGLTFFRKNKLPVHGYEQSSTHFLPTHCPNS